MRTQRELRIHRSSVTVCYTALPPPTLPITTPAPKTKYSAADVASFIRGVAEDGSLTLDEQSLLISLADWTAREIQDL